MLHFSLCNIFCNTELSCSYFITFDCELLTLCRSHSILGVRSRGCFGSEPSSCSSSSYLPILLFSLPISCARTSRSSRPSRVLFSISRWNEALYTGLPGLIHRGNPLTELTEISSACSKARRVASPSFLNKSERRTLLYSIAPS